jgi:nicotinamidase-related amidase
MTKIQQADIFSMRGRAGLPTQPAVLCASTTLILIDCQKTYSSGVMELEGVNEAIDEVAVLLAGARTIGTSIIHVQHSGGPGSLFDVDGETGAIIDRVGPRGKEPVVVKKAPNAFVGTPLDSLLKATSPSNVVIAGFMTHMCVSSTTRGAFSLGYAPTVVASATATRSLPGVAGGTVPAAVVQSASLAAMADLFAVVAVNAAQVLEPA